MQFNWKEVEEATKESPKGVMLKPGVYKIKIMAAEDSISKGGGEQIVINKVLVSSGDGDVLIGRDGYGLYWITYTEKSKFFFKKNMLALGLHSKYMAAANTESGNGSIVAADVVGKEVIAVIVQSPSLSKSGDKIFSNNKIAELLRDEDDKAARLEYHLAAETTKHRALMASISSPSFVSGGSEQDSTSTGGGSKHNDEIPF